MGPNQQITFTKRPTTNDITSCFQLEEVPMPTLGSLKEGQVAVASYLMSVDPTMRNAMHGVNIMCVCHLHLL